MILAQYGGEKFNLDWELLTVGNGIYIVSESQMPVIGKIK